MRAAVLLLFLACVPAQAASVSAYTEVRENRNNSRIYRKYQQQKERLSPESLVLGSARLNYEKFSERVVVPGFISSAPLSVIGSLVGPANLTASHRIGDTVYIQWTGTPGPREGDRYAVFTPAVVAQNMLDPTDFSVRLRPNRPEEMPENFRMAGYFYESSGTIRITNVKQSLVEAVVEALSGQISIGDQLMPMIPVKQGIKPAVGGIQLAAAVVSGSPVERLSTTKRSFIYINRGSRDGIREGRIFQAVETVPLDSAVGGLAPEISVGEAMVVHVSDSYSTAMITKQFEVIRIGSLLKTKQEMDGIESIEPFRNLYQQERAKVPGVEEIPNLSDLAIPEDTSLPDPGPRPAHPAMAPLSELDALEKSLNFNQLSAEERARLGKLSKQEGVNGKGSEEEENGAAPVPAPVDNSFRQGKPKKGAKKQAPRSSSDEEELNQLMMQN